MTEERRKSDFEERTKHLIDLGFNLPEEKIEDLINVLEGDENLLNAVKSRNYKKVVLNWKNWFKNLGKKLGPS